MGKCSFNASWLSKEDGFGYKIMQWVQKKTDHSVQCMVCESTVVVTKGFQALLQHAGTKKHQQLCQSKLNPLQLRLNECDTLNPTVKIKSSQEICLFNMTDPAKKAELIWAMKAIVSNYSFLSCTGISEIFKEMFPSGFPADFCLSPKKMSYLISDALCPYFVEKLKDDVKGTFFTLMYDETTNAAGDKELQTVIRYWSKDKEKVVVQHLHSFFIGSATAEILFDKLKEAMDNIGLPFNKLLMLGSDGPRVNEKVHRLMSEELKLIGRNLVNIGTCNIHIVHNAYLKGISEFGEDASELVFALYHFFDGWPSRWEDFNAVQSKEGLPNNKFIKHCTSRWLTLEAAAERVLAQWPAILEYFTKFLPIKKPAIASSHNGKKIANLLKKSTMRAEMHFIICSAKMFTKFTGLFQREEPLIHIMYEELTSLIKKLLRRFCKLDESKNNFESCFKPENYLPLKEIFCSNEIERELKNVKESDKMIFLKGVQTHYVAACKHLLNKTSLSSKLLKSLRCFHPEEKKNKRSCQDIVFVCKNLQLEITIDILVDEWKMYQVEKDIKNESRIDLYWRHIFSLKNYCGEVKYPELTKIGKAALILSHGNADVERGFSCSVRVLTNERASMSERTLNSILIVKSALKGYNNKVHLVPITKNLLSYARNAYRHYEDFLQNEKQLKEKEKMIKKEDEEIKIKEKQNALKILKEEEVIKSYETALRDKREKEQMKKNTADALFAEATERLRKGLGNKNLEEIRLAEAMLQSVATVRKEETSEREKGNKVQEALEKRKSTLIDNFIVKKAKNN